MPLILVVVLAAGTGDRPLFERKRTRPAFDRSAGAAGTCDGRPAALPCASFDPATGTLTWFDDDERYN